MIINKYIFLKKRYFFNFELMYGIAVSSGPAVMQFFILLAKTAFGKKEPSRYCGTVPLQGPVGGFSSGRGGS